MTLPRRTIRLRLTLLYGGLFLLCGAGLLAITYLLVAHTGRHVGTGLGSGTGAVGTSTASVPSGPDDAQADQLRLLLTRSEIALAIMAVVAVGPGWLMAGRMLRPLREMTAVTRHISEENLHRRLAIPGPSDELKDLGDTIDGLLARLESAFDAQRLFVANASHELRTPLTLERAMLEVALADPHATADSLRTTCEEVLLAGRQQEHTIEALLTLARSQRDGCRRDPVDLAAVSAAVLAERSFGDLRLSRALVPAPIAGDRDLVERLVANLVENAARYNVPGGQVLVTVRAGPDRAVLTVANTGPRVPPDQLDRLFLPFQRLIADRTGAADGLGLGLSIVAAVAKAHAATVTADAPATGGLTVHVAFPTPV